ncbi:imidazole glycerol phosphate synthase subunit HisH [Candidatus Woesearchaeota archaeon]|nr:imidazole glycerol phosphate synthase subunit HisH [Candidatus Woesearchaeota archaeon]
MIAIIDYGAGNLRSLTNAFDYLRKESIITDDPKVIMNADRLILPGDGSFGYMMETVKKKDLINPIQKFIMSGKPFLGICLGLQALFEESEESPGSKGLCIFKGKVVRFRKGKVPQIGWNRIVPTKKPQSRGSISQGSMQPMQPLFKEDFMYFVNSYYVVLEDRSLIAATTDYYGTFVSAIQAKSVTVNVTALQFHPEKSGNPGLRLLKRWLQC